jgi:hypothetical protein
MNQSLPLPLHLVICIILAVIAFAALFTAAALWYAGSLAREEEARRGYLVHEDLTD